MFVCAWQLSDVSSVPLFLLALAAAYFSTFLQSQPLLASHRRVLQCMPAKVIPDQGAAKRLNVMWATAQEEGCRASVTSGLVGHSWHCFCAPEPSLVHVFIALCISSPECRLHRNSFSSSNNVAGGNKGTSEWETVWINKIAAKCSQWSTIFKYVKLYLPSLH